MPPTRDEDIFTLTLLARFCVRPAPKTGPPPSRVQRDCVSLEKGFGFWLCLSLCADGTKSLFYRTQQFLYKTLALAHAHHARVRHLECQLDQKKKKAPLNTYTDVCAHDLQRRRTMTRALGFIWPLPVTTYEKVTK